MKEKEIRLLKADEIEVRVGSISPNGISLLLYKNARVDMMLMDEIYGPCGWMRKHMLIGDAVFCEVSVKDPDTGEWISRMDAGSPSNSEPVKGAASDSFKRACTNFGTGRELYTAPFIWIPAEKVNIVERNGRPQVKDSFHVQSISYSEDKNIDGLVILNQKNEVVFNFSKAGATRKEPAAEEKLSPEQIAYLMKELKRTGISLSSVLRKYKLKAISEMPQDLYVKAIEALSKTADKVA